MTQATPCEHGLPIYFMTFLLLHGSGHSRDDGIPVILVVPTIFYMEPDAPRATVSGDPVFDLSGLDAGIGGNAAVDHSVGGGQGVTIFQCRREVSLGIVSRKTGPLLGDCLKRRKSISVCTSE